MKSLDAKWVKLIIYLKKNFQKKLTKRKMISIIRVTIQRQTQIRKEMYLNLTSMSSNLSCIVIRTLKSKTKKNNRQRLKKNTSKCRKSWIIKRLAANQWPQLQFGLYWIKIKGLFSRIWKANSNYLIICPNFSKTFTQM